MSNSVQPQRRQPTRLPHPRDSPGKNTGVGCHFLLPCMKVKSESEVTQSCPTLSDTMTAAYQAPPSMGFSRQEYWSGVPSPSPLHSVTVHSNLLGTWHPLSQQLFFKQKKIYSPSRDFVGQGKFLMFTYMLLRCEP